MGKKFVCFGELVWDIFPSGPKLGGGPANLAFRLNSFGDEGILLTRIGDDNWGTDALKQLKNLNLSADNIQSDHEFPTGTVKIKVNDLGEADYFITPEVAFDHIEFTTEALKLVRNADCFCFGTLVQRYGISKNTLRELVHESPGVLKFLDLKLRENCYQKEILERSLEYADILRVKDKELLILKEELSLTGANLKDLAGELKNTYKIGIILVTMGQKGVFAIDNSGKFYSDPGYIVPVIDNVGSGVAFSAGFLHYYLNGSSIADAIRLGNAAGALVATTEGATVRFSLKEITGFMKKEKTRSGEFS
jgi:fructokinase